MDATFDINESFRVWGVGDAASAAKQLAMAGLGDEQAMADALARGDFGGEALAKVRELAPRVPHQFKDLVRRCCCETEMKHEHVETQQHVGWNEKAPHRVFMAAVDKIIMNPSRADEVISEHFKGVTDEERRVLKQYAKSRPSTKSQAQAVNMTEELYIQRLENLMTKTN